MELRDQLQSTLGSAYAIERELDGAGMSCVYVAEETAFRRKVVVKVLRPELAEAISARRFQREIQLAARLQHPHIVPLLSAGEADGLLYYTMPFVEGESLRDRLRREGELPIDETVRIVRDVASALAYAHRHGVLHRDIKPENVLLSDGGAVVADFGIAKALSASRDQREESTSSTTITERGMVLGTPLYMAPEQASGGQDCDHRADLYALGVVAYEMLAGRPPFHGRSAPQLMAAHAIDEPDPIAKRRPSTPVGLAALVMRCLEKRPADRPRDADQVLLALEDAATTPASSWVPDTGVTTAGPVRTGQLRRALPWLFLAALTAIVGVLAVWLSWSGGPRQDGIQAVRRWNIVLPDSAPMAYVGAAGLGIGRPALALSPDGSMLAYVAQARGTTMLYLRALDELHARPLPATEGAFQPFFSPDGRWVAYFTATDLKKVAVSGGRPLSLAQVVEPFGAVWLQEGGILVADGEGSRLSLVPESGGAPRVLTGRDAESIAAPQVLPGGWVLNSRFREISLLSLETGERRVLTRDGLVAYDSARRSELVYGAHARYLPSGHLIYASSGADGVLMALPFDAERRKVLGPPVPVLEGVRQEGEAGLTQFDVSDDGTLIYAPGVNAGASRFVWRDRRGTLDTLPFARADYGEFKLSPDGRRIVAAVWPPASPVERWLLDLSRGTSSRISLDTDLTAAGGAWWPDGQSFVSSKLLVRRGPFFSVRHSLTRAGERDTVLRDGAVASISADGRTFAVRNSGGLSVVSRDPARPRRLLVGPNAYFPAFSPDGQWLAYTSMESGHPEVYVLRLGGSRERHKISTAGGEEPIWSRQGHEIVYRNVQQWLAVPVSLNGGFSFGPPRLLFEGPFLNVPGMSHDLSPDGQRHLLLLGPPEEAATRLNVVTNWFGELRRLAPPRAR